MNGSEEQPDVGSVGEEAVKLLQALREWASETGEETGAAGAESAKAPGFVHAVNEHIATGSRECTYCPICQLIAAVRATSPEVKQHLTVAASSLLQAAAALLPPTAPDREANDDGLEHIDLSGDDDDWEVD